MKILSIYITVQILVIVLFLTMATSGPSFAISKGSIQETKEVAAMKAEEAKEVAAMKAEEAKEVAALQVKEAAEKQANNL